jgi:ribose 5-phosphate isomerase RpiB
MREGEARRFASARAIGLGYHPAMPETVDDTLAGFLKPDFSPAEHAVARVEELDIWGARLGRCARAAR